MFAPKIAKITVACKIVKCDFFRVIFKRSVQQFSFVLCMYHFPFSTSENYRCTVKLLLIQKVVNF